MLKVSILTPVYGVEKYIEQCARSLFEQSYTHIEYIFVNDCTLDHSMDILLSLIEKYPGRANQTHIINHEHNRGVGAARQTALMAATGDYIMFADSDDFLPLNAVEALVRKAESSEADLIDGAYAEWNNGMAGEPQPPFDAKKEKLLKLHICQNIITNRLWGRLYKRSLIKEHQIYFEEGINYAEDLFWNTQFLYYAKKISISEVVYYYRMDNMSSYCHDISEKNLLSYFKSTHRMIAFLQQKDKSHTFRRATDIGIVNAYRWAAQAQVDLNKADEVIGYKPHDHIVRLVIWLIKKGYPIKWAVFIYLSYRRLYYYLS